MRNILSKPFGYEPVLSKEDIKPVKKKKGDRPSDWQFVFKQIWKLVDEQRFLLITVLLLVVISSALALIGPFLIGKIIDTHIVEGEFAGMQSKIVWLIVIYVFLSVSMFLQNYWMIGIAQQTIYRMRTSLFAHFQKLPVSFFDKRQHGELMSRVTK